MLRQVQMHHLPQKVLGVLDCQTLLVVPVVLQHLLLLLDHLHL